MTVNRVLLLVLDGLGIGAMPDAGAADAGSHTLAHVLERTGGLDVPNLVAMGLAEVAGVPGFTQEASPVTGARGAAALGYPGADTYLGHQALMGAPLHDVELHMLADRRDELIRALEAAGHRVADARAGASALLVDGVAVVADNVEAAPGLNVNVTGSLDEIEFEDLLEIGWVVRRHVALPRVIVVGGRGFRSTDIIASFSERAPGHVGVDTPRLGAYDRHYVVRHLGIANGRPGTLPELVRAASGQVILLGKAADVIEGHATVRDNVIPTAGVLDRARDLIVPGLEGLVVANVQETDLAGHTQDAPRFRCVLEQVDRAIPNLLDALGTRGLLFVTADHGNDPAMGHSRHTREYTPVLVAGHSAGPARLGVRSSLADTAATIADILGVGEVAEGHSFADALAGTPTGPLTGVYDVMTSSDPRTA